MGTGGILPGAARRLLGSVTQELTSLATHAVLFPLGVVSSPIRATPGTLELPVIEVHGYLHNRSGFLALGNALRRRGFRWVHAMNNQATAGDDIPELAAMLAATVEDVLRVSGAPRVHLVGHSMGGLVARWYVQERGGAAKVDRCVTIATPHHGTCTAYLSGARCVRDMRPGSAVVRRLAHTLAACPTRILNIYCDVDALVVPWSSAVLPDAGTVRNHRLADSGHVSSLLSEDVAAVVCDELAQAEEALPVATVRPLRPSAGRAARSA